MDFWFLLVFTLAVALAPTRTGAARTSKPDRITGNTVFPTPATTTPVPTTTVHLTDSTDITPPLSITASTTTNTTTTAPLSTTNNTNMTATTPPLSTTTTNNTNVTTTTAPLSNTTNNTNMTATTAHVSTTTNNTDMTATPPPLSATTNNTNMAAATPPLSTFINNTNMTTSTPPLSTTTTTTTTTTVPLSSTTNNTDMTATPPPLSTTINNTNMTTTTPPLYTTISNTNMTTTAPLPTTTNNTNITTTTAPLSSTTNNTDMTTTPPPLSTTINNTNMTTTTPPLYTTTNNTNITTTTAHVSTTTNNTDMTATPPPLSTTINNTNMTATPPPLSTTINNTNMTAATPPLSTSINNTNMTTSTPPLSTTTTTTNTTTTTYPLSTTNVTPTTPPLPTVTITAMTTSPPMTTPLACDNGGISLTGVCVCPDEWVGPTCSQKGTTQIPEGTGSTTVPGGSTTYLTTGQTTLHHPKTTTPFPTTTTIATTTPTTTTPPTTTPLDCDNGGEPLNGVCICPDEWIGVTCSQRNFCQEQKWDRFTFPSTPNGWFAYSKENCPQGTSGAGKPEASTRCSTKNGSTIFELPPHVLKCDQTLSDIQQNLTSSADLESLASSTQILTSKPRELTAEDVTAAAQIANTLLLSPNATKSVREAAVATVSQLLNTSISDDSKENNATLGLTLTLDQLSVNLSLTLNSSQSQVVQPNLVVQSAQVPATDTQGVQFTSLSGTSGSFIADRIQLNTNTSSIMVENGFIADALIYVRFPPGEAVSGRQKPSNVSLGFVLYQNDRFFRSRRYKHQRATIRVLSASVKGQERNVVPQHVEMLFRPAMVNGTSLYDFACVFWNYSIEDWSADGCSKGNASDGLLRCFCNHTTNFAALWSFRENYEYAEALDWISITGLSFSILGLVVTIIHHVRENFLRNAGEQQNNKNSKIALLSICISLLAFIITFLSGVGNSGRQNITQVEGDTQTNTIPDSEEHVEPDSGSCSAVAALLHFFLLATFMWNSMYGTQLVLLVRTMRSSLPPCWSKLSLAVGWGVPAVVMAITLGVTYSVDNPLGYRQEEFCWLAALDKAKHFDFGKPMFWGFLVPLGLILIYNIVLLVLTSLATCRTDPNLNSTNNLSLMRKFLISFSLAVLLGLSWTLGYLVLVTTGPVHLVFSIVFCLCTTTQGLQIFILFTARTPIFKATISRTFQYISSVNIQLNYTKYNLTKNVRRRTDSESYRDLKDQSVSETLDLQQLQPSN